MIVTYFMDWLKVIVCCWVGQVFFCIISVVFPGVYLDLGSVHTCTTHTLHASVPC